MDKEYIASIIVAIRSAQKAAEKAQSASDEALKAQADLNRTIESIKQIVEGNTKFRNNIRAIKHIKDVDQIWLDVQSLISQIKASQTDIQVHLKAINILNSRVNQVETKFKSLEKTANTNEEAQKRKNETFESNINRIISDLREELQTINSLKKELADLTLQYQAIQSIIDKIEHLTDIDQLWESVQHLNVEILNSQSQIQTQITSISDLRNKYDQVVQEIENQTKRIEQLQQVLDNKTTAVETHVQSFSQDVTDIKGVIKKISDSVSSISEVENTEKKKTRMAFVLSGIALFVVIIHLILDILGVL